MAHGPVPSSPREGRITLAQWSDEWCCPALGPPRSHTTARASPCSSPTSARCPCQVSRRSTCGSVNARTWAAPATLRHDFATLRAVLNAAVDADRIARSPSTQDCSPCSNSYGRATHPDAPRPGRRPGALPVATDVLTGAVLGLRGARRSGAGCDIDFPRRIVTVAGTVKELAGAVSTEPDAKTEQSLRRSLRRPSSSTSWRGTSPCTGAVLTPSHSCSSVPRGGVVRRRPRACCARLLKGSDRSRRVVPPGPRPSDPFIPCDTSRSPRRGCALQRHAAQSRALDGTHDDGALFTSLDSSRQGRCGGSPELFC